ncbi:hypothetical protein FRX31_017844 [Thalictrum thalictroides]|uniref:Uncharacterized protein n=1 Tax=Thalictrum thalictroides TaxID=46969 RepID=A0A7J6W7R3_THATH|nr:hypothetical protein FRX31_017844 [Thalictrum thalictroides]
MEVDTNVELTSNSSDEDEEIVDDNPRNELNTTDRAGPSSVLSDENSEGEEAVDGFLSETAMKLIRKACRSFHDIRCKYQITAKRIEMDEVDKNLPDADDEHSILILEGQLRAGARLPLSKFVCDVLNHYDKAPINMSTRSHKDCNNFSSKKKDVTPPPTPESTSQPKKRKGIPSDAELPPVTVSSNEAAPAISVPSSSQKNKDVIEADDARRAVNSTLRGGEQTLVDSESDGEDGTSA